MKAGAIFDMDGLMFDTESIWQEGWKILARKFGYEPSPEFGREISGTSGDIMLAVIDKHYHGIDADAFISEERLFVEKRLDENVPVKKGLFEILDLFAENNVHMAVASSSRRTMIESNLKKAGCFNHFEVILSSTEVAQAKPKPDVFLEAAKRLKLDASDCYVFEDSFGGVRAGHSSGAFTVMIPDQLQPTEEIRQLADAIFANLSEAAAAIRNNEI